MISIRKYQKPMKNKNGSLINHHYHHKEFTLTQLPTTTEGNLKKILRTSRLKTRILHITLRCIHIHSFLMSKKISNLSCQLFVGIVGSIVPVGLLNLIDCYSFVRVDSNHGVEQILEVLIKKRVIFLL